MALSSYKEISAKIVNKKYITDNRCNQIKLCKFQGTVNQGTHIEYAYINVARLIWVFCKFYQFIKSFGFIKKYTDSKSGCLDI